MLSRLSWLLVIYTIWKGVWNFLPIVFLLNFMLVLYLWMMRENIRFTVIPVWFTREANFVIWHEYCISVIPYDYLLSLSLVFNSICIFWCGHICFLQMNPIINLQRKLQAVHLFHRMRMAKFVLHPMESLSLCLYR